MADEYRKALKRGRRQVDKALAEGRHPFPPVLDEVIQGRPFARSVSVGTCEIPLELVVGTRTRGRQNLFSEGFMPLAEEGTEFATKWAHLHSAQVAEGFRDPIVVYECLQRFYVQEGNKRVSVARYVGMPAIRATVTRVVPLGGLGLDEELARYEEFERFYRAVPLYDLVFSRPGDYERLAQALQRDLDEPWPEEDVRHLKAAYVLFCSTLRKRARIESAQATSDAFLRYVQTYATSDPLEATATLMDGRIRGMWSELLVATSAEPIAFVNEPEESRANVVAKVVSKVKAPKPLRVAFVYDRTPTTSGWVLLHERGRQELEKRLGSSVWSLSIEGCASNESFERAVQLAEDDGCAMVVTTSPRQMEQTRRSATAHPRMQFVNCSINLTSGVVRTFYARMYEVKFLMGALAASLSQSHQLGYLAFSPIHGTVAEINAFALGAALVDPYATVHLKWLSASPAWKDELRAVGVDVVCDRDYVDPVEPDEPFGLYVLSDGENLQVARPVWDWGLYYELMLREVLASGRQQDRGAKRARAINYWWGMRTGVVRLELATGVAQGQRRLVGLCTQAMLEGQLSPFDGLLVDQRGTIVRDEQGPALSDEQIASMSWLNINVVGSLPSVDELSLGGRADVSAAGVVLATTGKGRA